MRNIKRPGLVLLILLAALPVTCKRTPHTIPVGTWYYDLTANGVKCGEGVFSNRESDGMYVSTSELILTGEFIENSSKQVITETSGFIPVSLEIDHTITYKASGRTMKTVRKYDFNGSEVSVKSGNQKSRIHIDKPFVLDGNFFFGKLMIQGFKKGSVADSPVYDPAVNKVEPVMVTAEVVGYEDVELNGKKSSLLHIIRKIDRQKNIDLYINKDGITEKLVTYAENSTYELVRITE